MSTALQPTSEPPPTAVDERLAKVSFLTKLLQRPELGAMIGAGVVLIFFAVTAEQFLTLSGARDVMGGSLVAAYPSLLAGFSSLLLAPDDGVWRMFTFIAITVASDIGGYAVGVLAGRHPISQIARVSLYQRLLVQQDPPFSLTLNQHVLLQRMCDWNRCSNDLRLDVQDGNRPAEEGQVADR